MVEDDDVVRGTLVEALTAEEYDVRAAENGRVALAVLEGWRPDLILLDLMMPVMDGWAFREEQRRRPGVSDIPVILLSASRELSRAREALAPRVALAKPFELDELLDAVEGVMEREE